MSVTSTRSIEVAFTDDVEAANTFAAASNTASPGQINVVTLTTGANTITPPSGGTTPKAVTIIPPVGNTNSLTLKGVSGDTGIELHLTDPSSIALASATNTFVITASAQIAGVRFVWS